MNSARIIFANLLLFLSTLPGALRYVAGAMFQRYAQTRVLRDILARAGKSRAWFDAEPVRDYDAYRGDIERIQDGTLTGLTHEPVRYLCPTSGSTGGSKFIPYTASLKRGFGAGIDPWIAFLYLCFPRLFTTTQYWVCTPLPRSRKEKQSCVPILLEDDSEYAGALQQWTLAHLWDRLPLSARNVQPDTLRYLIALQLVSDKRLGLISAWNPTLLELVLREIRRSMPRITADLSLIWRGTDPAHLPRELCRDIRRRGSRNDLDHLCAEHTDEKFFALLWPKLTVISAWGDAFAAADAARVSAMLPHAVFQPKGLIATEYFGTLPIGAHARVLAYCSHFFEFENSDGVLVSSSDISVGSTYELIVTTQSGLVRYRTGDRIRVERSVLGIPSFIFTGRTRTIDLRGEKLDEVFAETTIRDVLHGVESEPRFWLCAPRIAGISARYVIYHTECLTDETARLIDAALRSSVHYAYCRSQGQLESIAFCSIAHIRDPEFVALSRIAEANVCRIGDIKPFRISARTDWDETFRVPQHPQ